MKATTFSILSAGASIFASGAALAQDAAPAAAQAGEGDIIVTAQRRAENLLDVPLSISATTGETLATQGIKDITSLRFNTPGFSTGTGTGYTQIFIRGIGNRIFVGADPSVSTFIDDVPRPYASLVDSFINVERVEVLKGAQGGLYGRNATAGVVNIITRQPDDELAFEAKGGYGTRNTLELSAFANVPLNENVAVNFSATRLRHDNYLPNIATRNPYATYAAANPAYAASTSAATRTLLDSVSAVSKSNNQDVWYVDGKIGFKGDGFKVTLAADYSNDTDAYGNFSFQRNQASAYGTYAFLMNSFGFTSETLPISAVFPQTDNKYQVSIGLNSFTLQKDYGGSANATIELPGFDLTSITAFRWNQSQFRGDLGVGAVPIGGFQTNFRRRYIYQEFRAVSSSDGPFSWLGGATYYHEKIENFLRSLYLGLPAGDVTATTKGDAWSIYGQASYNFTDNFKVTGSLRWISEKKTGDYPTQFVTTYDPLTGTTIANVPAAAATGVTKVDKLVPAVTINYTLDGGGTVYARWAQGLKTGGVNPIVHPTVTGGVPNTFKPEQVNTYEIGLRTKLLDRSVDFTSAIFYNDFKNLQITKTGFAGLPFVLFNAGSARTYGAEVAVNWRALPVLQISANLGYLNAKFKNFASTGIPTLAVAPFNNSGKRLPYAPEWQGGVTIALDQPITERLNLAGSALVSYSSSYSIQDDDNPLLRQKSYALINLRGGVKTNDDRFGFYVSVRNLTNKFYAVFGQTDAIGAEILAGDRRVIMGQVEVKF